MLHACPEHYEQTPLCQVHVKDILPQIDVRQSLTPKDYIANRVKSSEEGHFQKHQKST